MSNLELIMLVVFVFVALATIIVLYIKLTNSQIETKTAKGQLKLKDNMLDGAHKKVATMEKELRDTLERNVTNQKRLEMYNQLKTDLDKTIVNASAGNKKLHQQIAQLQAVNSDALIKMVSYQTIVDNYTADNKFLNLELEKVVEENMKLRLEASEKVVDKK